MDNKAARSHQEGRTKNRKLKVDLTLLTTFSTMKNKGRLNKCRNRKQNRNGFDI
jgi:hypothetical protein